MSEELKQINELIKDRVIAVPDENQMTELNLGAEPHILTYRFTREGAIRYNGALLCYGFIVLWSKMQADDENRPRLIRDFYKARLNRPLDNIVDDIMEILVHMDGCENTARGFIYPHVKRWLVQDHLLEIPR